MVRTYRILPDTDGLMNHTPRFVNQIHTQPTAGMFAKVSSKPTNHSKSTGLSSSNNKSKRRNNHKDEFILNDGVRFSGVSASGVLNSFYQHEDEYQDQEKSGALDHHVHELEDEKEGDDIVVDRINEEDWCFVGADA